VIALFIHLFICTMTCFVSKDTMIHEIAQKKKTKQVLDPKKLVISLFCVCLHKPGCRFDAASVWFLTLNSASGVCTGHILSESRSFPAFVTSSSCRLESARSCSSVWALWLVDHMRYLVRKLRLYGSGQWFETRGSAVSIAGRSN